MIAICTDNTGFEDALETRAEYPAKEIKGGSILIDTAKGERWHGSSLFELRAG